MEDRYEPLRKARFSIEQTDRGEAIRIKTPRPVFLILFLPVWLTGWTLGGGAAAYEFARTGDTFLGVWLIGWALGWIWAAAYLLWLFGGREILSVQNGDLVVLHQMPGFRKQWRYRGADIRNLSVAAQPVLPFYGQMQVPFFRVKGVGSAKFDYGSRTFYLASGLDEPEGRQIVEHLARRLPASSRLLDR